MISKEIEPVTKNPLVKKISASDGFISKLFKTIRELMSILLKTFQKAREGNTPLHIFKASIILITLSDKDNTIK